MPKMNEFLKDCLSLPYKSNSLQNPEHENQVEELLIKHGLEYVAQPNGSQNFPDFHVVDDVSGKIYSIECKSSKDPKPIYNGGRPHENAIYVFSSAKYNETTIFNGSHILSEEMRNSYDEYLKEQEELLNKYKDLELWKENSRGFGFYNRAMYIQSGGKVKTDYFIHQDRYMCEQNVINKEY